MEKKHKIVISGINIINGGPLTILKQVNKSLEKFDNTEIIFLLNNPNLLSKNNNTSIISFPLAKKNWIIRLFYEWIFFYFLSIKIKPDIWFSLHDISPNVKAKKQYVYCHNPSIFLKIRPINFLDIKLVLFKYFYKYLYRININKNDKVFVQQNWIKDYFKKNISLHTAVDVIHPVLNINNIKIDSVYTIKKNIINKKKIIVTYPTLARSFKNIEFLINASKNKEIEEKFIFYITISGNENLYARYIKFRASKFKNIKLIGFQKDIDKIFNNSDIIISTSLLETWSLPLSEAAYFKKIVIAPDLPYANENLKNYPLAVFYNPYNISDFVKKITSISNGNIPYRKILKRDINDLNWNKLWKQILN